MNLSNNILIWLLPVYSTGIAGVVSGHCTLWFLVVSGPESVVSAFGIAVTSSGVTVINGYLSFFLQMRDCCP